MSGNKAFMTNIDRTGGIKELRATTYQGALPHIFRLPDKPKTTKKASLIKLVERAGIKRTCIASTNKTIRTARQC
jgi:transposase